MSFKSSNLSTFRNKINCPESSFISLKCLTTKMAPHARAQTAHSCAVPWQDPSVALLFVCSNRPVWGKKSKMVLLWSAPISSALLFLMLFVWVSMGSDVYFVENRAIACLQCRQQDEGFDLYFVSKDECSNMRCVALRVWVQQLAPHFATER